MMSDDFDSVEVVGIGPVVHINPLRLWLSCSSYRKRIGRLSPSADRQTSLNTNPTSTVTIIGFLLFLRETDF
jgi:hypothetical protein